MNIKSIAVLNFTELCSLALVPTLDNILGNDIKYIEVESKKFKELFFYYIKNQIEPYEKSGLRIIITNSCLLQNNWRYVDNGYNYVHSIVDSHLQISDRKISDVLDYIWRLLCKNSSYNTIRSKELDNTDLTDIIRGLIGDSHLTLTEIKLEYISDLNTLFPINKNSPQYLIDEINQILRNYNLII